MREARACTWGARRDKKAAPRRARSDRVVREATASCVKRPPLGPPPRPSGRRSPAEGPGGAPPGKGPRSARGRARDRPGRAGANKREDRGGGGPRDEGGARAGKMAPGPSGASSGSGGPAARGLGRTLSKRIKRAVGIPPKAQRAGTGAGGGSRARGRRSRPRRPQSPPQPPPPPPAPRRGRGSQSPGCTGWGGRCWCWQRLTGPSPPVRGGRWR